MKPEANKQDQHDLEKHELHEPALYQVVMHNDDFTPMEFVVNILEDLFFMNRKKATEMMLQIHTKGKTAIGRYTKEVAESKVAQVIALARMHEHPLVCSMEVAE